MLLRLFYIVLFRQYTDIYLCPERISIGNKLETIYDLKDYPRVKSWFFSSLDLLALTLDQLVDELRVKSGSRSNLSAILQIDSSPLPQIIGITCETYDKETQLPLSIYDYKLLTCLALAIENKPLNGGLLHPQDFKPGFVEFKTAKRDIFQASFRLAPQMDSIQELVYEEKRSHPSHGQSRRNNRYSDN